MLFENFVNDVADRILDYLPAEYKNATVEVGNMRKLNNQYTALTVRKEDQAITPTVNLDKMFEELENGRHMGEVLKGIAALICRNQIELDPEMFQSYEAVKDKLFLRVSSAEKNKEVLDKSPHQILGDLAVSYHIMVENGEEEIGSTLVTNELLEFFGISRDQLHADAVENTPKLLPPYIEPLTSVIDSIFNQQEPGTVVFEEQLKDVTLDGESMLVLTNREKVNGAAVMFYPGVMEQIAEQTGKGFYILPSSVHELILVSDDDPSMTLKDLESVVHYVNHTELQPEDFLSDHAYHYDRDSRAIELGKTFEERKAEQSLNAERPAERASIKSQLREAEKVCERQLPKPKTPGKETTLE